MIHLDTHVVLWLGAGEHQRLSPGVAELIRTEELGISPMVVFELEILHEIGRVSVPADVVVSEMRSATGLRVDDWPFGDVVRRASTAAFGFTRDPFDRLVSAHAALAGVELVTKDRRLRQHLDFAIWPS